MDTDMTPAEVAEELNVSLRTVRRWIADGTLASRKVVGRVRIKASDVAALPTYRHDNLTIEDAALILRKSEGEVRRMAENGLLRARSTGDRRNPWLVSRADVEAHKAKAGAR